MQFPKRDWSLAQYTAEDLLVELFTMLYRHDELVICDRCWPVTSVVYNRLAARPTAAVVEHPPWLPDLRVLWLIHRDGVVDRKYEAYRLRLCEIQAAGAKVLLLPWLPLAERVLQAQTAIALWLTARA